MTVSPQDDSDLLQVTLSSARFVRKNIVVILVFVVAGIITSVSIGLTKSRVLQSKMVLFSDILTKAHCEQLGRDLNNLIHDPTNPAFAILELTPEEASQVQSVETDFIPERIKEPEAENSTLVVTAEVSNRLILPRLQNTVIGYFRSNAFVKIRVSNRKILYEKMIEKIHHEISSLDSLKKIFGDGKAGARTEIAFVDPSEINQTIVDLYKQEIEYKTKLETVDSVQLVEGFSSIGKPPHLMLSLLLLLGFIGGAAMAFAFLGVRWLVENTRNSDV